MDSLGLKKFAPLHEMGRKLEGSEIKSPSKTIVKVVKSIADFLKIRTQRYYLKTS